MITEEFYYWYREVALIIAAVIMLAIPISLHVVVERERKKGEKSSQLNESNGRVL